MVWKARVSRALKRIVPSSATQPSSPVPPQLPLEVLWLIIAYTDRPELKTLRLVCHDACDEATKRLWSAFTINSPYPARKFGLRRVGFAYHRYLLTRAYHISRWQSGFRQRLRAITAPHLAPLIRNLTLTISHSTQAIPLPYQPSKLSSVLQFFGEALMMLTNLESLTIDVCWMFKERFTYILNNYPFAPNLHAFTTNLDVGLSGLEEFWTNHPSLAYVHFHSPAGSTPSIAFIPSPQPYPPSLTHFRLATFCHADLLTGSTITKVTKLEVDRVHCGFHDWAWSNASEQHWTNITSRMLSVLPDLTYFSVGSESMTYEPLGQPFYTVLLPLLVNLRHLVVWDAIYFPLERDMTVPAAASAIAALEHLEELDWRGNIDESAQSMFMEAIEGGGRGNGRSCMAPLRRVRFERGMWKGLRFDSAYSWPTEEEKWVTVKVRSVGTLDVHRGWITVYDGIEE